MLAVFGCANIVAYQRMFLLIFRPLVAQHKEPRDAPAAPQELLHAEGELHERRVHPAAPQSIRQRVFGHDSVHTA